MAHIFTQVRKALLAQLITAGVAGGNGKSGRATALDRSAGVGFSTYILDQDIERGSNCGPVLRGLTVQVVVMARGTDADDNAEALMLDVERAIDADETLGGLVEETTYRSAAHDYEQSGEDFAIIALNYDMLVSQALTDM